MSRGKGGTRANAGRGAARGSQRTQGGAARSGQNGQETRRTRFEQRKAERAREATRQRRNQRIWRVALWGGGVAAAALVLFLIVRAIVTAPPDHIAGVVTYSNLARDHVPGKVTYPQTPPVGGQHSATLQNCGVYDQPVGNEHAVHSLEHGAVWITYQPDLSSAEVDQMRSLVRGHDYVILSPYPGLPSPVVASAWGLQLKLQSATDPRLGQFIQKYEQGPQDLERGAPCSGGTGTPIG